MKKELSDSSKNKIKKVKKPIAKDKINSDASKDDEKNQNFNKKDSSENETHNDSQSDQKESNKSEEEELTKKEGKRIICYSFKILEPLSQSHVNIKFSIIINGTISCC